MDYPVYARKVAEAVAAGAAERGIMIDGAGIGSSMVANKVPGVRAAMAYDLSSARNGREHNRDRRAGFLLLRPLPTPILPRVRLQRCTLAAPSDSRPPAGRPRLGE